MKTTWLRRTGFALIVLSTVFFFTMISVPWMPIESDTKVYVGGTLFASAQIAWWIGIGMVGPTAVRWIKSWFRAE